MQYTAVSFLKINQLIDICDSSNSVVRISVLSHLKYLILVIGGGGGSRTP